MSLAELRGRRSLDGLADLADEAVLAVFAHPDDAELACWGTLARMRAAGCEICNHVVTRGETTANGDGHTAVRRLNESKAAGAAIGVEVSCDGLPDGSVAAHALAMNAICRRMRIVRPSVVITHHPDDPSHQDHRAVAAVTIQAAVRAPDVRCILLAEPPLYGGRFAPTLFVDVTDHFEAKLRAVGAHKSEASKPALQPDVLHTRARWWALQAGADRLTGDQRYEAFEVYRAVIAG